MKSKFDYLKQPNFANPQRPWASRPLIPVRLSSNGKHLDVFALVDSGADSCLFHSSIASELGIQLDRGRALRFFGISGDEIDVYSHEIDLQIIGIPNIIKINAGFTESRGVAAILGQSDFFEHFHVTFKRDKERLEIEPV